MELARAAVSSLIVLGSGTRKADERFGAVADPDRHVDATAFLVIPAAFSRSCRN